jgi:hypothetical protein
MGLDQGIGCNCYQGDVKGSKCFTVLLVGLCLRNRQKDETVQSCSFCCHLAIMRRGRRMTEQKDKMNLGREDAIELAEQN